MPFLPLNEGIVILYSGLQVWLIYWLIAKYVVIRGHALISPILRRLSVTPFAPLTRWFTVMERDLRITGSIRGQSGNALAPKGFEVSNPWKVRLIGLVLGVRKADTDYAVARETNLLRKRRASTLCVYKLFPIFREISIAFLFKITIARILFYAAVIIVTVVPSLYYVQKEKNPRILLDLRRQATDSLDLIFAKV